MKFYAVLRAKWEMEALSIIPPVRVLMSYYYFSKDFDLVRNLIDKNYDIIIDSGAYSAMTMGASIDIDEYCKFIIGVGAKTYVGLDVIGNPEATAKNIKYMEDEYFLNPIPTFHVGGDLRHLEALKEYPYIAIGGMIFNTEIERQTDRVWNTILTKMPGVNVHGFGLTGINLISRYPWYSIDSSTYKSCRRYGFQLVILNGFKFDNIPEKEYRKILTQMGYKLDGLSNYEKYKIYDFHSYESYRRLADHLTEINKIKDFSYLTAQQKLF